MIDPSKITEGVYDVQHAGQTQMCEVYYDSAVSASELVVSLLERRATLPLSLAIERGWQFTRRYIPCDGEPVECEADIYPDGSIAIWHCPSAGETPKHVRGLFVPLAEPGDDSGGYHAHYDCHLPGDSDVE